MFLFSFPCFFPIWPKRSNTPEEDDRNHICGSLFLESAVNQTLVYGLLTLSQEGSYYWGIPVYVDTKSFKGYWYIRTQSSSLVLSSLIPSWVQLECLPWDWELIQYLHYWECIFLLMKYSYQPLHLHTTRTFSKAYLSCFTSFTWK